MSTRILVTCPPMLRMMEHLRHLFGEADVTCPEVVQTLSETELTQLVPSFDGWILGDDPATRRVFAAGKHGRLKAAVKWGVGTDNVDFAAAKELAIPVANTPHVFGREVADLAMSYIIALARDTYSIHEQVKAGFWPKPTGISLADRTLGLIGFGDIGRNVAKRALAADMNVIAYDPNYSAATGLEAVEPQSWPARIDECDFLAFTCALTAENRHMLDAEMILRCRRGVRVVNVARGPLIDETALAAALASGQVYSAALDVFEVEPLPLESPLREREAVVFGSHNASNTRDAVIRASKRAIALLFEYLKVDPANAGDAGH